MLRIIVLVSIRAVCDKLCLKIILIILAWSWKVKKKCIPYISLKETLSGVNELMAVITWIVRQK